MEKTTELLFVDRLILIARHGCLSVVVVIKQSKDSSELR